MLRNLTKGMETKDAAYDAYEKVLKPYHGWMTQQARHSNRIAITSQPNRNDVELDWMPQQMRESILALFQKCVPLTTLEYEIKLGFLV